jgi:hypothetical protein
MFAAWQAWIKLFKYDVILFHCPPHTQSEK